MSEAPLDGPEFRPEPWQDPLPDTVPDAIPDWARDTAVSTVQDAIPDWALNPPQYPVQYPPQHLYQYPPHYPPPMYPGYYGPPMPLPQTSGHATAGVILGGLSLFLFITPFGPVLSIGGIIFSLIGLSQSSKPGRNGTGLAAIGLVCSSITLVLWMLLAVLLATIVF